MRPLCRKNHVHKIPRFREGYFGFGGGGEGSANFIFMGARIVLKEERRGIRNGYEASKGSKGTSSLLSRSIRLNRVRLRGSN